MDSSINYQILDANNLSKTIDNNIELLQSNGFSEETNNGLKTALQTTKTEETAQRKAEADAKSRTTEQEQNLSNLRDLIKRLRNTVRAAFDGNTVKMDIFKVSDPIPNSLKNLVSLCDYLSPLVTADKAELMKNGLLQEDVDQITTASARIMDGDAKQEQAKKLQVAATITRNNAAKELNKQVKKVRAFIKARFENKPEIAVLFDPIVKGRGGENGDEDNTNTPQTPTTPTTPAS